MSDNLGPYQDDFYNALMDAHAGLSEEASHALNARLVLMLANRVGDIETLTDILEKAREYNDE
ncbi:DUF2783 domain-containing protein [Sulfitobacter sp. BDSS02]|nr:DUF2783 domain-containing protein [Sulfitobacter sp. BDSS02]MBR9850212.1 DUF2783 domain-containing protein [Paracoccaceae bacterium]